MSIEKSDKRFIPGIVMDTRTPMQKLKDFDAEVGTRVWLQKELAMRKIQRATLVAEVEEYQRRFSFSKFMSPIKVNVSLYGMIDGAT